MEKSEVHFDEKLETVESINGQQQFQVATAEDVGSGNILNPSFWTRTEVKVFFVGVLFQSFCYAFETNLMYGVIGYVTSVAFQSSSLTTILPTILQILSATLVPFYTNISDVIGRTQALTFAFVCYILGYVIQGSSSSFSQFAGGQILYSIGSTGMLTLTQVLLADTTTLRNRGIAFALWDLSSIPCIFLTQIMIDPLTLKASSWRISYVIIACVTAVGAIALLIPLWVLQRKGERIQRDQGLVVKRSFAWFLTQFDALGAFLMTLAMALTFLPIILARSRANGWSDPFIYGMLIGGLVSFALLGIYEAKYTEKPFMPMRIWMNRTTFGGLTVNFFLTLMASLNWGYFTVYLVVSRDLTFGGAILLERGYQVAYLVMEVVAGLLMRRYNTYRPFIWAGIVTVTGGILLMIPARAVNSSDFFVVISQTIVGIGGGLSLIGSQVAVTGSVAKKDVAGVIGAGQILGSFAGAVGGALAGGMWTNLLPKELASAVPAETVYNLTLAMNDPTYIAALEQPLKSQIIHAYGETQKILSIVSAALAVFACATAFMMKPLDLNMDQETQDRLAAGEVVDKKESPSTDA